MRTRQVQDYADVKSVWDGTLFCIFVEVLFVFLLASSQQCSCRTSAFQFHQINAIRRPNTLKFSEPIEFLGRTILFGSENEEEEPIHSVSFSKSSITTSRRRALNLLAATSVALIPSMALALTARQLFEKDPLERGALGGQWGQLERSMLEPANRRSVRVPAALCTYLTRFLIRYDREGISEWWKQQEFAYSMMPESVREAKLVGLFGMISKSVEQAIQNYIGEDDPKYAYTKLWDLLDNSYGKDPDAKRHIGILFCFLPISQQPSTRLLDYCQSLAQKTPVSSRTDEESDYFIRANLSNDLTQLLPSNYQISFNMTTPVTLPSQIYFTISPKIALYKVGTPDKLDVSTLETVFGPLGAQPLIRERPSYSVDVYSLFGLAGACGCALTHAIVIPLDVVKTRSQTDSPIMMSPNNNDTSAIYSGVTYGIFDAGMRIVEKEGISGLLLGAQATLVGYFWYGISVYPSYTFLKRYITQDVLSIDYATSHANEIALVAGALAAVIASLGLTPLEAARIRVVAEPQKYRSLGLTGTLKVIAKERNLYAGLPSLLTRQVIFGSVKFLAFERACELIFVTLPFLRESTLTELAVSLVAGGFSGVLSSVVSQPADSVLTYVASKSKINSGSGNLGFFDSARIMVAEGGVVSLFRGLGSRCVWAGSIIAGQFLLYDIARSIFRVTPIDLSQVYEITFTGGSG